LLQIQLALLQSGAGPPHSKEIHFFLEYLPSVFEAVKHVKARTCWGKQNNIIFLSGSE
jgi:hypothetical protein